MPPYIPLEYLTLRWARLSNPNTWLTSRPSDATPENCICRINQCSPEISGSYAVPLTDEAGIPITQIYYRAFYQVEGLTSLVIGSNITAIGNDAFMYSGLVTLTVESSATFGLNVCRECPNLESVFFGENVEIASTTSSTWTFAQCPLLSVFNPGELGDVVMKAGFYGSRTFAYNIGLTEVVFPEDFAPPGASACSYYFDECTNLTEIKVYNPAMLFPTNLFRNVPALTTVYGYPGSTAEAWAAANSKTFIILEPPPFPSQAYKNAVVLHTRDTDISGKVTLTDGTVITIDNVNIKNGTLYKTNKCTNDDILRPGSATSAELGFDLYVSENFDPYTLEDGRVEISYYLKVSGKWYEVPLGTFTVSEAKRRTETCVTVKGYDDMMLLNEVSAEDIYSVMPVSDSLYNWLAAIAASIGAELGISESDFKAMPNGNNYLMPAVLEDFFDDALSTAWDLLQCIAQMTCSIAYIDRWGRLALSCLHISDGEYDRDITDDERNSETISLYKYKTGRITTSVTHVVGTTYVTDFDVGSVEDGITLELMENRVLRLFNDESISGFLQNILAVMPEYYPAEIEIWGDPTLEIGDKILLTDEGGNPITVMPITSYDWKYRGGHTVKACGTETASGTVRSYADKAAAEAKKQAFEAANSVETNAMSQSIRALQNYKISELQRRTINELEGK